jgi:hypothetical protein
MTFEEYTVPISNLAAARGIRVLGGLAPGTTVPALSPGFSPYPGLRNPISLAAVRRSRFPALESEQALSAPHARSIPGIH